MEEIMELGKNGKGKEQVLVLVLMDASTSMYTYGDTPVRAVKQYIKSLIKAKDNKIYYVGVIGFNRGIFKILAMDEVHQLNLGHLHYQLDGGTHLYDTVDKSLHGLLAIWEKMNHDHENIVVGVFSDGWDRWSNEETQPQSCQFMAKSATLMGWKLLAFGIGINGRLLARYLGFPEENGHTVNSTREGLMQASRDFSEYTTGIPVDPQDFNLDNSNP